MNRILLAGIDTLEVGYSISEFFLTESEIEQLTMAKTSAGLRSQSNTPSKEIITFRDRQFVVMSFGTSRHSFILENEDITIKLNPRSRGGHPYPEVHITYRAESLWRKGWQYAADEVGKWIRSWARVIDEKIARADLCADIEASMPELSRNFEEVMCRAKNREEYIEKNIEMSRHVSGHKCTGYTFGKGGNISINIYNKTHEVLKSNKQWFYELWKHAIPELKNKSIIKIWPKDISVTRVEARCRRKFLKSMQINTIDDLKKCQADLWRYLTNDWMTVRDLGVDKNHSRWSISTFWATIQDALKFIGDITGITRLKQMRPRYQHLINLCRGVLVSIGANAIASIHGPGDERLPGIYGRRILGRELAKIIRSDFFIQDIENRSVILGSSIF
jgi:hypothetical protein